MANPEAPTISEQEHAPAGVQKKWMISITLFFIALGLVYSLYWFFHARHFQETDNAYVNGNIVPISAQVSGNIIAIEVDDTSYVDEGQVLVRLDETDAQVALEQTKANLAQTIRQTQQYYIKNNGLLAMIQSRESDLHKAQKDLKRRQQIITKGAISQEELTNAEDVFNIASASLAQAKADWQANRSLILNTTATKHPLVKQAADKVKQAYLDYIRTTIKAPLSGYVAKRSAQIGQRVSPGQVLMAVVALDKVWVDANFKEKQLQKIKIGQPVILHADMYGSKITYHGWIMGLAPGTGSVFSLLPAQNATGNWIKVVQRLAVRIGLNEAEIKKHPLRIGLSMEVSVDTRDQRGKPLTALANPSYTTSIFEKLSEPANQLIAKIVKKNLVERSEAEAWVSNETLPSAVN